MITKELILQYKAELESGHVLLHAQTLRVINEMLQLIDRNTELEQIIESIADKIPFSEEY